MEKNIKSNIDNFVKNIDNVDNVETFVFVEISKGSNIKYEFNKELNLLVCDRILQTPVRYTFNYGFIPNTLSEDSDPIDTVILTDEILHPGCMIKCKIIGCLETSDSEGNDPKLIMCPIDKIDPNSKYINDISDLNSVILEQIKYFFFHYKDLENKIVLIGNFLHKKEANDIYFESIQRFKLNK